MSLQSHDPHGQYCRDPLQLSAGTFCSRRVAVVSPEYTPALFLQLHVIVFASLEILQSLQLP